MALGIPPADYTHHTGRGSQCAAAKYRARLAKAELVGSMGRCGNPCDNAKMESLMKTLKVEGVYSMAFQATDDVVTTVHGYIDLYNTKGLYSALGYLTPTQYDEANARQPVKSFA